MSDVQDAKSNKSKIVIAILVLVILILCAFLLFQCQQKEEEPLAIDQTQSEYVKPENPIDRSKNVTLPGWGGFTIPANSKTITQGFEFHNPAENFWYEDQVSVNGSNLETLVVDSGNAVELNHYLKLANINGSVTEVKSYDNQCFNVVQNSDGAYTVEGIAGFEGEKTISVETDAGETVDIQFACNSNCYYMTFGLYLSDGDELLYQSDLVAPGKYIQQMEMSRSLASGIYDAYVVCQPYKSDQKTETNQGVVKITLTAK